MSNGTDQPAFAKRVQSRRELFKTGGALAFAGALPGVLAACGGSNESSADTPKVSRADVKAATGTTTVLTYSFYKVKALNEGKVKAKYAEAVTADEMVAKTRSRTLGINIPNTGVNIMPQFYATERLVPIPTDALSNYQALEARVRDYSSFKQGDDVFAVPFAVAPGITAWDSEQVPEPTSADQLLGSEYENKIGLLDEPDTQLIVLKLLGRDLTKEVTTADLDAAKRYLIKLKPNIRTLFPFGQEVELLGRGDIAVALQTYGSLLTSAQEANSGVQGNFFGALAYADSWSLVEGSDAATALSWIDQSISTAGQRALQKASGGYAVREGSTDESLLPPELANLTLEQYLQKASITPSLPVDGSDGIASRSELQASWDDFKARL